MARTENRNNLGREANAEIQKKVKLATAIFAEYGNQIRTAIQFNLNDKSQIDDIFQNVFLSIVHKPVPKHIENIRGYLYIAIINDIVDMARRTKSYRTRIRRYAECRKYSIINDDPENILIQAEERQKMIELIEKQLPPREAQAVTQRYAYDIDIGQAAQNMDISRRSLSRYLCVGLKKIRQYFRENKGDGNDFF